MTFINLFHCNLQFGSKFGFRSRALRCPVISRCAGAAARQLVTDGSRSRFARQFVRYLKTFQSKCTSAADQIIHFKLSLREKKEVRRTNLFQITPVILSFPNFYLLPSNFYLSYGLDITN